MNRKTNPGVEWPDFERYWHSFGFLTIFVARNTIVMTNRLLFVLFLLGIHCSFAQLDSVVAKPGDGIFSMLRQEGIPPIKYYVPFLELNKENIRNASELIVGKTYKLPHAPDSFKNRGRLILVDQGSNRPLFQEELATMQLKDSSLGNAVYYLLHTQEKEGMGAAEISKELKQLSAQLLSKGATVFVLENANGPGYWDTDNVAVLGDFTTCVNREYLKNRGKSQRAIVIRDVQAQGKELYVTVGHHGPNSEGRQLSGILQDVFRRNAVVRTETPEAPYDLKDAVGTYLAKNLLPPLVVLTLNAAADKGVKGIRVKSDSGKLAQMLEDGLWKDGAGISGITTEE
jgi:N-acetylmuramoyl-L-alanine amidase